MKAVIFDLDDTLYSEMDFVRSGFAAVARVLARRTGQSADALAARMLDILAEHGRGHVFDTILSEVGARFEDDVRLLLYVYRSHRPELRLFDEARPLLEGLREAGLRLGIVTDGLGSVQRSKIAALEVEAAVDAVVCTDDIGREWWKPSTTPFRVALALLGVHPSEAVYVGNDPAKDFAGPNALGMLTIQIGPLPALDGLPDTYKAIHHIDTLADIPQLVGHGSIVLRSA